MFFEDPGANFDLASFSFQLPIFGSLAAKHKLPAMKHNATVNAIALAFMFPPD
jgi:hypothetical protein